MRRWAGSPRPRRASPRKALEQRNNSGLPITSSSHAICVVIHVAPSVTRLAVGAISEAESKRELDRRVHRLG